MRPTAYPIHKPTLLLVTLSVWFALIIPMASAQQYAFYTYDNVQFPDIGEITSSMQDSRGFLWFSGSQGIVRYDGCEFRRFSVIDGLPNNFAYNVVERPDGRLSICTWGGACIFDPVTGLISSDFLGEKLVVKNVYPTQNMTLYATSAGLMIRRGEGLYCVTWRFLNPTQYNSNFLVDFHYDPRSDLLWLVTEMDGIYSVKLTSLLQLWEFKDKAIQQEFENLSPEQFLAKHPSSVTGLKQGVAHAAYSTCLHYESVESARALFQSISTFYYPNLNTTSWFCYKLQIDNNGMVWVLARDGIYRIQNQKLVKAPTVGPFAGKIDFFRIFGNDQAVAGSDGLFVIRSSDTLHFSVATGLSSDEVSNCLYDSQGIYWITTKEGVLHKLPSTGIRVYNKDTTPELKGIIDAVQTKSGDVFIATTDRLMKYFDNTLTDLKIRLPDKNIIRGLALDCNEDVVFLTDSTLYLYQHHRVRVLADHLTTGYDKATFSLDHTGKLWISCGWFIRQWDGKHLHYHPDWQKSLLFNNFIHTSEDGSTIFGNWNFVYRLQFPYLYRFSTGDVVRWDYRDFDSSYAIISNTSRIKDPVVTSGAYAFDSHFYLGTFTGSIMRLQGDTLIDCDLSRIGTIGGINRCVRDLEGNLYFLGSEGVIKLDSSGFSQMDLSRDHTYRFNDLYIDSLGNRFFATSNGLLFTNNQTQLVIDHQFGLTESNVQKILALGENRYLLIQPNSIVSIDFNTLWQSESTTKPVWVTGVWANNTLQAIKPTIELALGQRTLKIRYASMDFLAEKYNRYRWKLNGFTDTFSAPSTHSEVTFLRIPPGTYQLYVQATNVFGHSSEIERPIIITVPAFFYETTAFRVLIGVLLLGTVAMIYSIRLQSQKRANILLEEKVAVRTKELAEALENVKVLSGFIPICASCKHVRDDQGYWQQVEQYISERSDAQFSHSICPDCARKLYPEFYKDKK
ncbi:MAG: hypothetical protein OEM52_01285 [bacterium]|nr:hypothetical protein [bacterium]